MLKSNQVKKAISKTVKIAESPKWSVKANETIKTLKAKKERSQFDTLRLVNQMFKIENRSLSKIYKDLSNP
mgnify:FL=1